MFQISYSEQSDDLATNTLGEFNFEQLILSCSNKSHKEQIATSPIRDGLSVTLENKIILEY